jgi:MtN3 and saliva related transmembrane protein
MMASPLVFVEILGGTAGVLTTMAFLPQVIKVIRTKSTSDLSLGMCLTFSTGVFLWFIYGLCLGSTPLILANTATFIFSFIILWYKIKCG